MDNWTSVFSSIKNSKHISGYLNACSLWANPNWNTCHNLRSFIHIITSNIVSQSHFEKSVRMKFTFPKWELGSPRGVSKFQSSISKVKTPCIEVFFVSLESYQSIDVENGLAWAIWTSATQGMAKRKVGSQTGNLIPDHQKLGIDPTPMRAGGVKHAIGKLSTRATSLL